MSEALSLDLINQPLMSQAALKLRKQGYLQIDDMATEMDIATIYSALHRIQQQRKGIAEGALFDFVGDGSKETMSFPQIFRPSVFAPELLETEYFKSARALAVELLGPEARFNGDHALVKPARVGPITPWHQDEAFRDPEFEVDEISIWLALRPTTIENGCMRFLPGSQTWDVLPHRRLGGNPRVHALECTGDFNPDESVACALPAGGVTVHTSRTLHGAGPNLSAQDRHGYVLNFETIPRKARVPRAAPWLAEPDAREQRERAWRKRGGIFVHVWRQINRYDLRDGKQLRHVLGRGTAMLQKGLRHIS